MSTDVRQTFDAQRAAWNRTGAPSKEARLDALGRLASMLKGHADEFATLLHIAQDDLPFGGIGMSGFGAYHGRDGFRRFSHARGVYEIRGFNPVALFAPPYGNRVNRLIRLLMRSRSGCLPRALRGEAGHHGLLWTVSAETGPTNL